MANIRRAAWQAASWTSGTEEPARHTQRWKKATQALSKAQAAAGSACEAAKKAFQQRQEDITEMQAVEEALKEARGTKLDEYDGDNEEEIEGVLGVGLCVAAKKVVQETLETMGEEDRRDNRSTPELADRRNKKWLV